MPDSPKSTPAQGMDWHLILQFLQVLTTALLAQQRVRLGDGVDQHHAAHMACAVDGLRIVQRSIECCCDPEPSPVLATAAKKP